MSAFFKELMQGIAQATEAIQKLPKTMLPCPFCGADAKVSVGHPNSAGRIKTGKVYSIGCSNANCLVDPMTSYGPDLDTVIANWNKRV